MGHLINPISYRLGYSRNWGFAGALMESKSQYFYLNSKYYNLLLFFKRIFSLQTFEKMGILFSHLRFVNSFKSDIVIIYLYDGPFQNDSFIFFKYLNRFRKFKKILKYCKKFLRRFMGRTFILFYYFRTLELIYEKFNNFLQKLLNLKIIKFLYYVAYIKSNFKIIDNIYLFKSFFFKSQKLCKFFINNLFLKKLHNFLKSCFIFDYSSNVFFQFKNFMFCNKKYLSCLFLVKSVNIFIFRYKSFNLNLFIKIYNVFFNFKKFYNKINRFMLNFYNEFKNSKFLKNIKEEFFEELLKIKDSTVIYILIDNAKKVNNYLLKGLIEIFTDQRLKFYEFCQKFLFLIKKSKKRKFIFLNFFFKFLIFFTSNLFIFFKNIIAFFKPFFINSISSNFLIYFKNISKKDITAALIGKYICIRLRQKFTLKEIMRSILKDLSNNPTIKGFKLSCCGRFTKKEIATYRWERKGNTSLNTVMAQIDYSFNFVILKYSVCGIKIWLHKNSNYKYFFKKWFENFRFFYKKKKKIWKKKLNFRKFNKQNKNLTFKKLTKRIKNLNRKSVHKIFKKKKNDKIKKVLSKKIINKQKNVIKLVYNNLTNLNLKNAIKPFLKKTR